MSTDDSPQLESRKGSMTDFGNMSNRGSSRRSSRIESKLPVTKRLSAYEASNSLQRYSSQETSSPSIKRPSSLSSFTSISTLVAKQSSSSVVSPLTTITPKTSAESSPVTTHRSPSPFGYPVNTLPSTDDDVQEPSLVSGDAAKTVGVVAGEDHNVPMQMLSGDQAEKITDTDSVSEAAFAETTFMKQKKKLSPVLFGSRSETGPFEIEVIKGFWGLGMTIDCDKTGAIFVKALTSHGALNKDGNIKLVMLSIIC